MDELVNNEMQENEVVNNEMATTDIMNAEIENNGDNDELLDQNSDQVSDQVEPETETETEPEPDPIPEPEEFHDYQLTPDDIAKGYKLLPNFDDIVDDGTIEKDYAIFKGGEVITTKLPWEQFETTSEVFHAGDEVRKDQGYRCHYSGRYMVRSEWVSGYTNAEYLSLFKAFDVQARESGYCMDEWRGVVKAQKIEDVANDHYNLKTKEEQEEWEKQQAIIQRDARIAELKAKMLETDYVWNVIREGDATEEYYADVLANRKAWRAEIRELEKQPDDANISPEEKAKQGG